MSLPEPDLTAPGKPMLAHIVGVDGVERPFEIEQTKWGNCQDLMREIKDANPTDEELDRWDLTRREYEHFLMDLHDHQANTLDAMTAQEAAMIERHTGEKVERPALEKDQLGFLRLKDAPEPQEPTGEPEPPGRKPPEGTSWG